MAAAEALHEFRGEAEAIQHALHGVAVAARRIDTREFEVEGWERIRRELVPTVHEVMEQATDVLAEVLEHYDRPTTEGDKEDSGVFSTMFDDMVDDTTPNSPRQRIADMSYMARWELDRKRGAVVEAEATNDDWRLIAHCCSARRRVIKAASGVERVVAEVEAFPSLFGDLYLTERQRAVETRAAYYSFMVGVRQLECTRADMARCIRLAGTGIARLIGREIYQELRIEDRRTLRSLQARLFTWLREARDDREGQRLHSEVVSFASLLMEVNQRAVLVDHDREVLAKLLAAVHQPATDAATFHRLLRTIRGRDPELDRLIELEAELRPSIWAEPAEQVLARLSDPFAR